MIKLLKILITKLNNFDNHITTQNRTSTIKQKQEEDD